SPQIRLPGCPELHLCPARGLSMLPGPHPASSHPRKASAGNRHRSGIQVVSPGYDEETGYPCDPIPLQRRLCLHTSHTSPGPEANKSTTARHIDQQIAVCSTAPAKRVLDACNKCWSQSSRPRPHPHTSTLHLLGDRPSGWHIVPSATPQPLETLATFLSMRRLKRFL